VSAAPRMDASRLQAVVDRFAGRRVAVLGDLVADEFVYGDIARISREAPVLILEHRRTVSVPGGAGNAVANLSALDARPVPVGIVGRDDPGARLLAHFRSIGVPVTGIGVAPGYETPSKSRILAGGVHTRRQQIVRLDRGAPHGELPSRISAGIAARLARALLVAEGLLVGDYGYGASPPSLVRAAVRGKKLGTTVDSRARVARFRSVTACTPNQEEVELALGLGTLRSERAVEGAARELLRRSGNRAVLITRGAKGMCLVERGAPALHIPAFGAGEVADVTGAGDTVIAAFTLALLSGAAFAEAAFLANLAAGLAVMKYGTATVARGELREAIREACRP
jgi:D-glycero-beta-D-manno-heptose-7-phosphate kinase